MLPNIAIVLRCSLQFSVPTLKISILNLDMEMCTDIFLMKTFLQFVFVKVKKIDKF